MHDTQDLNLMKRRTHLLNPLPANFAVACRIASLQCQKSNNICQMPHGFSLFKNTQVAIFPVAVTSFWAQLRVRWVFQKWSASDISFCHSKTTQKMLQICIEHSWQISHNCCKFTRNRVHKTICVYILSTNLCGTVWISYSTFEINQLQHSYLSQRLSISWHSCLMTAKTAARSVDRKIDPCR